MLKTKKISGAAAVLALVLAAGALIVFAPAASADWETSLSGSPAADGAWGDDAFSLPLPEGLKQLDENFLLPPPETWCDDGFLIKQQPDTALIAPDDPQSGDDTVVVAVLPDGGDASEAETPAAVTAVPLDK